MLNRTTSNIIIASGLLEMFYNHVNYVLTKKGLHLFFIIDVYTFCKINIKPVVHILIFLRTCCKIAGSLKVGSGVDLYY